jgi:hypothetical protein
MTGKTRTEAVLGKLEDGLNMVEEKTHPFYDTWKGISTLRPVWRYIGNDLGGMLGWRGLIDKIPQWIQFLEDPAQEAAKSDAVKTPDLLRGSISSFAGVKIITRNRQTETRLRLVNEIVTVLNTNPDALAMQVRTLRMLLLRLHGDHHHHHGNPVQHQLEHLKDRRNLALLNRALVQAVPELAIRPDEIAAFDFRTELPAEDKKSYVLRGKLLGYLGEHGVLCDLRQQALDQVCLRPETLTSRPSRHVMRAMSWDMVLAASLFVMPVTNTARWGLMQMQPPAARHPAPQALVTGAGQYYEHPELRDGGLYVGAITLSTFASLLRRKRQLKTGEKMLKVAAFGGHITTEATHFVGVFMGLAEKFPHFKSLLDGIGQTVAQMPFIGGEFITENLSDVWLAEGGAELAHRIITKTPLPEGRVKDALELALANAFSLAGTLSLDQGLAALKPFLLAGMATAFGGYGLVKIGHTLTTSLNQQQAAHTADERHHKSRTLLARFGTVAASVMAVAGMVAGVVGGVAQPTARAPVMPPSSMPTAPRTASQTVARPAIAFPVALSFIRIQSGSWFIKTLEQNGFSSVAADRIAATLRSRGLKTIDHVQPQERITVMQLDQLRIVSFRGRMQAFDPDGHVAAGAASHQLALAQVMGGLQQQGGR